MGEGCRVDDLPRVKHHTHGITNSKYHVDPEVLQRWPNLHFLKRSSVLNGTFQVTASTHLSRCPRRTHSRSFCPAGSGCPLWAPCPRCSLTQSPYLSYEALLLQYEGILELWVRRCTQPGPFRSLPVTAQVSPSPFSLSDHRKSVISVWPGTVKRVVYALRSLGATVIPNLTMDSDYSDPTPDSWTGTQRLPVCESCHSLLTSLPLATTGRCGKNMSKWTLDTYMSSYRHGKPKHTLEYNKALARWLYGSRAREAARSNHSSCCFFGSNRVQRYCGECFRTMPTSLLLFYDWLNVDRPQVFFFHWLLGSFSRGRSVFLKLGNPPSRVRQCAVCMLHSSPVRMCVFMASSRLTVHRMSFKYKIHFGWKYSLHVKGPCKRRKQTNKWLLTTQEMQKLAKKCIKVMAEL